MAIKNARYNVNNGAGYDTLHFETDCKQVKDKIVSLNDVNLVTEQGFLVDALAVKELYGKFKNAIQVRTKETRLNVTAGQRTYSYVTLDAISGYTPVMSSVHGSHYGTVTGGAYIQDGKARFVFDAKTTETPETFVAVTLYVKTALL